MLVTSISIIASLAFAPAQAAKAAPPVEPAPVSAAPDAAAPDAAAPDSATADAPAGEAAPMPAVDVAPPVSTEIPVAPTVTGSDDMADSVPPVIDDFALAHQSPDAPPRATAVVHDDSSGVDSVTVYFRTAAAGPFSASKMTAGSGGLFLGSLENGIQRTGFFYYVEAKDAAGNVTNLGTAHRPIYIDAAGPSVGRVFKKPQPLVEGPPVHNFWIALAYGAGIIGGAAMGVVAFDMARVGLFWNAGSGNFIDDLELVPSQRPSGTFKQQLEQSLILDGAIMLVAGIVAVAGMTTGSVLLVINALEE